MDDERKLVLDGIFYDVRGHTVLQGGYVEVEPGRVVALVGPNGSGKTTLLEIAAGQIQASSGITILDGRRLHRRSRRVRFAQIAYLPQASMLPADLAVGQVLSSLKQERLRGDPLLEKLCARRVAALSGGERRYLEVSLVLGMNRDYILLDEPFTGVEPHIIDLIVERIREAARRGGGVLISDHYHQYLLPMADRAYLLRQKQCYLLEGDLRYELRRVGYLRA